ncbi:MAG: cation-translocating P-type ATPase [Dethiobacteria bacterium]|jgi:Ca2+-transporting ATPase
MPDWSTCTREEALRRLRSDAPRGLGIAEVTQRQHRYGLNLLPTQKPLSLWRRFFAQFADFLVAILLVAAAISFSLGESTDALVILVVIAINAILGTIQEYRAEKALDALKTLSAPTARVIRDGEIGEVPARKLVPGDVVIIETGDFVPADGRLLETADLKIDQSALTGESRPVEKKADSLLDGEAPLAEKENMVHMGTTVTFGRGKAVVTGTGMYTEIGRIAGLIENAGESKTPLQGKLARFGHQLGLLTILLCLLVFFLGITKGNSFSDMFFLAVSLAVAAIPEGLPAVVTIVLALGVQRMARRGAIIRKLPAVETLGTATVICSDKTGTLTHNAMTVRKVITGSNSLQVSGEGYETVGNFTKEGKIMEPADDPPLSILLKIALLNNNASLAKNNGATQVIGDPTEGALIALAGKAGYDKKGLEAALPRLKEYPFDSKRKMMTTVHHGNLPEWPDGAGARDFLMTKGAPGEVLERCSTWLGYDGIQKMDPGKQEYFLNENSKMARQALRVLAFALKPLEGEPPENAEEAETGLVFVGLAGMIDPPRQEAGQALELCRQAGIRVKMITGDHKETAQAIAREMGLAMNDDEAISGSELDRLDRQELRERVDSFSVFARVSPEHKVRVVEALQARGEIVAMTGDGINDAPALKKAHIGTAMGLTGTDVAKEAAEMVLADDNFATIVHAVQEGRVIFENIRKAIYFLLSANVGEILTIIGAMVLGWPLPLLPIQLLWINLVTDSLPALSLGVEPPERGTMQQPPRGYQEGIFQRGGGITIAVYGIFIAAITLLAFYAGWQESTVKGQTMAFAALALSQLVHVINFRSLKESALRRGLFGNRLLLVGMGLSIALQLTVLLAPFPMSIFRTVALASGDWLLIAVLASSTLAFGELWKR